MRRKRNIILYKVAERESDSWDDRRTHDGEVIGRLMNTLELSPDVVDFHRLGNRYAASKNDKTVMTVQTERPLLVTLKDEDQSHKVLTSLSKLRNAANDIKKIRVSPDLSLQERSDMRELVIKTKNLNAQEGGDYWHLIRGQQIIKVKKRKPQGGTTKSGVSHPSEMREDEAAELAEDQPREATTSSMNLEAHKVEAQTPQTQGGPSN